MARGLDANDSKSIAPPRRNPFRQEIAPIAEKVEKQQYIDEVVRAFADYDVDREKTEERALQDFEQKKDKQIKEDKILAKRKEYLVKKGISDFAKDSPGYGAIVSGGYQPDDYEVQTSATEHELLQDGDSAYAYTVSHANKSVAEGFASDEKGAKKAAAQAIEKLVEEKIFSLEKEEREYIERKEQERDREEEEAIKAGVGQERKDLLKGLDAAALPFFPTGYYHAILKEDEARDLERETLENFDIVSFLRKNGLPAVYIFKDGQVCAASDPNRPLDIFSVKEASLTNSGQTWHYYPKQSRSLRENFFAKRFPGRARKTLIKEAKDYIEEVMKGDALQALR